MNKSTPITALCLLVPILALALFAGLAGYPVFARIATLLLINLILVLGLQVFMGNSGILSFAHIAFMAIGAYASSVFSIPLQMRGMVLPELYEPISELTLSPTVAILFGGLMATLIAALVSYPLMRLSDAAAVITSFALLMVIHTITVNWSQVTNGPRTLFGVPAFTTLPVVAVVAALAVLAALAFRQTRTGLLLRALRDDELAAVAMGAHPSRIRWCGFVVSALFAGIAGGLWAHFITSFQPNAFYLKETFLILAMLVIGGAGSVTGAVLGTFLVTLSFEGLRLTETMINTSNLLPLRLVGLTEIVLALAMIMVLVLRPSGLMGAREIGELLISRRRRTPDLP
ncbi:amino acid/amide ABC transporter membrane protein 2, HAAT family [Paracoccus alcaliphilus]|uniref:Amino acid/amide ABC transporter membrane protein 2, HAAT family n=1 Tax=Paracoccus alcaliphilus TaxID=34002 RepID=A0A1H8LSM9_9RHOB|nr:branched-chain amino acid ABC transporter permease [Paracoccus alcaliphilus]WCR17247.1 branched-chain amino acid ABC transporter permease [Paracoccus alcaliphilus]SEO08111.1 amino acid/amide ABC transporter membrane protein 2, HAAT family [Paracoccus alcaliphilus]